MKNNKQSIGQLSLRLQYWPNPILGKAAVDVKEFNQPLAQLSMNMRLKMQQFKGIGLAAPQVGHLMRLIVLNVENFTDELINPILTSCSEEKVYDYEACLSFPGVNIPVERHSNIIVEYQNLLGEKQSQELEGLAARCVQHEIDHLNGITFMHYLNSAIKRDIITRKMKKLQKQAKYYEEKVRQLAGSTNQQR